MENIPILFITLYFVVVFIYHIKAVKRYDSACMIYTLWAISSLAGLLYANSSLVYQGKGNMTIMPILFLILMYHLTMSPINRIKFLNRHNYEVIQTPIITITTYILAAASILPFIENVLHIITGQGMSSIGDLYDERSEMTNFDFRSHMTWLGARLNSVTALAKYITPFLFIHYIMTSVSKKKWIIVGLVMGIFNPAISMFNMGSRWTAVEDIIFLIFLISLYRDLLPRKIIKMVLLIITIIGAFIVIGVGFITLGRFSDTDYLLSEWLYRYMGEGFYNFATDMWFVNNHSEGMHLFRGFYDNAIAKLNKIMGIRMYVFYTYIGDLYADWGMYITIGICILMNMFANRIINKKRQNIYTVFIICMYCKIFLTGFTYIVYINTMSYVLIAFIFFYICNVKKHISKS